MSWSLGNQLKNQTGDLVLSCRDDNGASVRVPIGYAVFKIQLRAPAAFASLHFASLELFKVAAIVNLHNGSVKSMLILAIDCLLAGSIAWPGVSVPAHFHALEKLS